MLVDGDILDVKNDVRMTILLTGQRVSDSLSSDGMGKGDERMITQKDVAQRAGVTVTTVSRMLNGHANVSKKTRQKIERAMRDLNYLPNELARSLSLQRSTFIGLIVPSTSNPFFGMIAEKTERYAFEKGYKLLLCNSNHEKAKEIDYLGMLRANKVAGIILATRTQDIHEFTGIDAPLVSIDRIISTSIPYICSENYQGGMMATEHLISRGCRKLAHISGSSFLDMHANKRFEGFRDACLKHGLPYVLLDASEEQFISMQYSDMARHFLETYPDVDGVFTSNDIIAAQILQECSRKGIAVPQRLKIVGYDDIEIASLTSPPITTIHQDVDSICRSAISYIDAQCRGEPAPVGSIFPVSLVIREST